MILSSDKAVRTTSPSPSQKDATFQDVAPEPLLPNYGAARIRTYELDMIMMNLLGVPHGLLTSSYHCVAHVV